MRAVLGSALDESHAYAYCVIARSIDGTCVSRNLPHQQSVHKKVLAALMRIFCMQRRLCTCTTTVLQTHTCVIARSIVGAYVMHA
jgi:hypothetical protein